MTDIHRAVQWIIFTPELCDFDDGDDYFEIGITSGSELVRKMRMG